MLAEFHNAAMATLGLKAIFMDRVLELCHRAYTTDISQNIHGRRQEYLLVGNPVQSRELQRLT